MCKTIIQFIHNIREGGAETIVKDYALLMNRDTIKVVVVTLYPPESESSNYRLLKENGIKCYTIIDKYPFIKPVIFQKIWNKFFFIRYCANKLLKICREEKACCIHVHLDLLKFIAPISKELCNTKLIYTCHSLPTRYLNNSDKKMELKAAKILIAQNNLLVIALHNEMKQELIDLLQTDNVIVVPNGVDFSKYNILETKDDIRRKLNIPLNAFVVGHVGRFSYMKNHNYLIKVFLEIIKKRTDSFLLLVGDGPEKDYIEKSIINNHISNKVLMLSHRSDIPQLLRAMDIFIFPSMFEGLPVSVVEAQKSSLKVLLSNTITKDCIFYNNVIRLDINSSPEVWASAALDNQIQGDITHDISTFDMRNVIEQLEYIYTS